MKERNMVECEKNEKNGQTRAEPNLFKLSNETKNLLPFIFQPAVTTEAAEFLGDAFLVVCDTSDGEVLVNSRMKDDTSLCTLHRQIFQGCLQKTTYFGSLIQFLTQSRLDELESLFLQLRVEGTAVFSDDLDDQELTGEILAKEVDVVQDTRELAALHASTEAINLASRSGDAKVEKACTTVQLLQDRNILRSPDSREELVGRNGIRGRVVSTWDYNVSKGDIGDTLYKVTHPIRMKTDREVNRGNCWDATGELAAVNGDRRAWACHRTLDPSSTITGGEIHVGITSI